MRSLKKFGIICLHNLVNKFIITLLCNINLKQIFMRIIDTYKIKYNCGIEQEKNLITHEEFENVIKPKQKRIAELKSKGFNNVAKILNSEIIITYGNSYFTTKSPLYKAIKTKHLKLPNNQGGVRPCSVCCI